jgi:hypothetical protein
MAAAGAAKQPRGRFGKLTHESARPISRRGQYGARLTAGMPEVCSLRTDKRQIVVADPHQPQPELW